MYECVYTCTYVCMYAHNDDDSCVEESGEKDKARTSVVGTPTSVAFSGFSWRGFSTIRPSFKPHGRTSSSRS